jgi:hypothetical protein
LTSISRIDTNAAESGGERTKKFTADYADGADGEKEFLFYIREIRVIRGGCYGLAPLQRRGWPQSGARPSPGAATGSSQPAADK